MYKYKMYLNRTRAKRGQMSNKSATATISRGPSCGAINWLKPIFFHVLFFHLNHQWINCYWTQFYLYACIEVSHYFFMQLKTIVIGKNKKKMVIKITNILRKNDFFFKFIESHLELWLVLPLSGCARTIFNWRARTKIYLLVIYHRQYINDLYMWAIF